VAGLVGQSSALLFFPQSLRHGAPQVRRDGPCPLRRLGGIQQPASRLLAFRHADQAGAWW
jgi:hypothetical protein